MALLLLTACMIFQKPGPPQGLTAEYFSNIQLQNHRITSLWNTDNAIQAPDEVTAENGWSGRFSGYFTARLLGGGHRFSVTGASTCSIKIYVKGTLVYNKPANLAGTTTSIALSAGEVAPYYMTVDCPAGVPTLALRFQPPTETQQALPSTMLSPTTLPVVPSGLMAVGTASNRIAVYSNDQTSATGFNIYRSTVAGSSSSGSKRNALPHRLKSYPSASMMFYSDSGLNQSTQYFYSIKSEYQNPVTQVPIESSPSVEVSSFPDPEGIPYDSLQPSLVLSRLADVSFDQVQISEPFFASGPDGAVFANDSAVPLAPEAVPNSDGSATLSNGTKIALPGLPDEQNIPSRTGPFHRRVTTPGFSAMTGTFYLPPAASLFTAPQNTAGVPTEDTAYLYLGSTAIVRPSPGTPYEVQCDAGLVWVDGVWKPIIMPKLSLAGAKRTITWRSAENIQFAADSVVTMQFFTQRVTGVQVADGVTAGRNVFLRVTDLISGNTAQSSSFIAAQPGNGLIRMKCIHSIAQTLVGSPGFDAGFALTNSRFNGSYFENGRVGLTLPVATNLFRTRVDQTGTHLNNALLTQTFPAGRVSVTTAADRQTVNIGL